MSLFDTIDKRAELEKKTETKMENGKKIASKCYRNNG